MSQKTNPTSLRLQKTNKHFSSSWYSDLFYNRLSVYDLQARSYIEKVSEQMGHSQSFSHMISCYRRLDMYLFFIDTRGIRYERERTLRLSSRGHKRIALTATSLAFLSSFLYSKKSRVFQGCEQDRASFAAFKNKTILKGKNTDLCPILLEREYKPNHSTFREIVLQSCSGLASKAYLQETALLPRKIAERKSYKNSEDTQLFVESTSTQKPSLLKQASTKSHQHIADASIANALHLQAKLALLANSASISKSSLQAKLALASTAPFHSAIEKALNFRLLNSLTLHSIRVISDSQSAEFLAREIAWLIHRGAAFKQVQDRLLNECTRNELIKGIRLSCSGRVGGRSKKAQKAKTQSVQWGETSLHVFSSRLSFASTSANTLFGKIGIKVWLCFKS